MAAAVLVDPPVRGPGARRDDGVGGALLAVPIGDPDLVRQFVAAADLAHEVLDPRGAAAVDAGDVAERVQLHGPGFEEGERRRGRARGLAVGLHVEVDRAARAHRHGARFFDRVDRGRGPLRGRLAGVELGAAGAGGGRRLQADVGGDQVPARFGLRRDPGRASGWAASRRGWRRRCRRRSPGRGSSSHAAIAFEDGVAAGVEAEPGEGRPPGGSGRALERRRQARRRGPRPRVRPGSPVAGPSPRRGSAAARKAFPGRPPGDRGARTSPGAGRGGRPASQPVPAPCGRRSGCCSWRRRLASRDPPAGPGRRRGW